MRTACNTTADAPREENRIPGLVAKSTADNTVVVIEADPTTKRLLVNAILASNSGVDIGDVDVTSVIPGTGATNLGKAIDSAGGATDTGVAILAIRDDTLTTLTPVDGDYVALRTNSTGALHVTGGGGGTEPVLGTATYTEGTTVGTTIAVVRNDTLATLADTDNELAPLQVNASGALYTVLSTGSASIGTLAANSGVDIGDVDILSIAAGDNNIGNVDIVSGVITTVTTLTGSGLAHDAIDSGNPHKIGGRAQEQTAQLEEVANDDRADAAFDRQGRLATWMGFPVQSAIINDATSGNNTIQAAAGAGLRIAVIGCVIVSDGTVDVRWEDGADGGSGTFTGQIPLQAREGFVMPIGPQPWFVGTADVLLNLELTAAVNVHGIVSFVVMTD